MVEINEFINILFCSRLCSFISCAFHLLEHHSCSTKSVDTKFAQFQLHLNSKIVG